MKVATWKRPQWIFGWGLVDSWTKEFLVVKIWTELDWIGNPRNPWSYSYKLNLGCSVHVLACNSPIPAWNSPSMWNIQRPDLPKTSPNRAFGLRWNRCNLSSKTSMDHQLLLFCYLHIDRLGCPPKRYATMSGIFCLIAQNPVVQHKAEKMVE